MDWINRVAFLGIAIFLLRPILFPYQLYSFILHFLSPSARVFPLYFQSMLTYQLFKFLLLTRNLQVHSVWAFILPPIFFGDFFFVASPFSKMVVQTSILLLLVFDIFSESHIPFSVFTDFVYPFLIQSSILVSPCSALLDFFLYILGFPPVLIPEFICESFLHIAKNELGILPCLMLLSQDFLNIIFLAFSLLQNFLPFLLLFFFEGQSSLLILF